jgi:hypothetical protein
VRAGRRSGQTTRDDPAASGEEEQQGWTEDDIYDIYDMIRVCKVKMNPEQYTQILQTIDDTHGRRLRLEKGKCRGDGP